MIKVSTKQGDKGETGLADGSRKSKTDIVFAAIGDVDELNSWLGFIVVKFGTEFIKYKKTLLKI